MIKEEKECLVISKLKTNLMNLLISNIKFQFVNFWLPYFTFGSPKWQPRKCKREKS